MTTLAFKPGPRRRAPFPFDAVLGGLPLMLGSSDQNGPLVSSEPQSLDRVAPPKFGYSAQSPQYERIQAYDDFTLGFGLKKQKSDRDRRYWYALNADLSMVPWLKGPNITTVTPTTTDSTNGVEKFFESSTTLYALVGRYALIRSADTAAGWGVSKDFGSGNAGVDVTTFYSNVSGGTNLALVAMGDSVNFWSFDFTTWTQHASLKSRAFAVVGNDIYRAYATNTLGKVDVDANPLTAANWSVDNAFYVGDKNSGIVRLGVSATGVLTVFKTDGIYSLDEVGEDQQYFPFMKFAPNSNNGKGLGSFLNDLYINYAEGFYRLTSDFRLEEIGPERLPDNDSVVQGNITAFAGHANFHAYGGLYNIDTGNSYLMKFGVGRVTEEGELARADLWHGSISSVFTSKKITALHKSSIGAVDSNHTRMYIGFSDGTIGWFTLPCKANPAGCTKYTMSASDGEVYPPIFDGEFPNDQKALRAVTVGGLNLSSNDYVQIEYRTDAAAAFEAHGTNFDTNPLEYAVFPNGASGGSVEFKFILKSNDTVDGPEPTNIGIHYQVRPVSYLVYTLNVLAENGLVSHMGTPLRVGVKRIRDFVRAARSSAATFTLTLPDESAPTVSIVDYGDTQAWDQRLEQLRAAIKIQAAEVNASETYGTVLRLSPYTIADLSGFTVLALGGL